MYTYMYMYSQSLPIIQVASSNEEDYISGGDMDMSKTKSNKRDLDSKSSHASNSNNNANNSGDSKLNHGNDINNVESGYISPSKRRTPRNQLAMGALKNDASPMFANSAAAQMMTPLTQIPDDSYEK
ncbi:hypothetical protein RFI_17792 [Reticulomyxa filosa]|uniref:Uncharacterized protein n=1 Tax=Reticulomyxa filosa TaxID=46433 RepID=X6N2A8_RETFI|nr:hypothetical protein RFI_17792 [Reticulomyxa filosa]|eukprot:ETO19437.1 hypothetical protein RFI_17792 [Reticulomyxa filosa]